MIPAIQEIGFGPGTDKAYATLHQATVSFAEMGERTISTQVRIDGDVVPDFDGWEVSFKGERFILNTKDPQAVKDNSTRNSLVDLTFVSWVVNELKRYFFFEPTSIDSSTAIADKYKASVNLPVEDFAVLFNKVLDYYFDGKVVFSLYMSGQGQYSTDRALVEIDYTYIWDVLVKFFEIYGVRWRIECDSTNDVYTIKAGWPTTDIDINDHDFEYGYNGGLLRFERQVQDVDIHNILLGRGGEKNIPYRYFKRIDPQNPDWAADPDAIPELSNIYFDRLRDINFRWYVRGWMQNPNHDTSWEEDGYVYPTYTIASDSPYYFAYQKGLTDEKFNPVEYVKDDESIADYGEHWGALDDNDDIFPTIQGVTRDPLGRIDETVAISEIVTDDIDAMAQNAAIEKSINRMVVSNPASTTHTIRSEFFTIPSGTTGNIDYAWVGSTEGSGVVHIDTVQSSIVVEPESGGNDLPISGIPAGTYRLRLDLELYVPSGQSAVGTFGLENIRLTTSSMDTDAWKPTFDIWVKNIWGTTKGQDENDIQYAERVWLPILGDRAGNEAKIVFSSGFMSVSEDYEFTIVSYPVYDTSKSINGVHSEWRITLRKSDAEFDATGLYIPNASTGGQPIAGDKFFFIGIDMPFRYVELAEEDLNTNKEAQLDTEATISPTWIMNLDKVRVHTLEDQEYGQTLADRLAAGGKVWIKDKRFTPGQRLQLYVQSITYTWNEPSDDSPYIVPDIEVVLSDKVVAVDSVVQRIQNDVSSIKNQYARISDVEAVVRSVAEPIFLKKTGESDSSDSPTQFSSKVTSKGFRQGAIGGTGWGIYRDNTSAFAADENEQAVQTRGTRSLRSLRANVPEQEEEADAVIEADRIVVRKELQVNSLVINQIAYVGGKEIISAAKIEVSKVIETANGYICYFDQRRNSVANNFAVNDIAFGQVFNPDNTEQRYYKMVVTATDVDCITLAKSPKDGSGAPKVGDIIVQYGNTTNTDRQYVIVRDVIGGGYERMLSGLNSVSSTGKEYYFAGRQNNSGPRWFVGDSLGDYAEYEDGVLTIKANVIFKAGQEIPGLAALETQVDNLEYLHTALPKSDTIISGGLILSKVIALRDSNNAIKSGINGDPTLSSIAAWYGGPMADKEATPTPSSYAQSLFRFDGSGYLAGGNIFWNNQGYGGIPGVTWSRINGQDVVSIGANVQLESLQGADSSVTDLIDAVNSLADLFEVVNGNVHVKNNRGFYSDSFISAGGLSDSGGTAGGNASMQLISGGGRITNGTDTLDVYSMSRVDQLLASAGTVQTVAGVSPSNGDIPVASLQTALSLGAAAYKAVGSVASGNTGLVTGGDVWTAIDNLPEPMVFKGSLGTGGTISSLPAASSANEGFTYKVITAGTYRGTAAKVGDTIISNGSSWILIPSGDEPEGTVTSVGLTMPTGFSVGSSPITSSGTLAVTFASGYSLPTTAKQSNWDTAYGWGNHANAGYLLATTAANTYATISALNGVSGRVTTLENRTNWDTYFGIDDDGNVYVKKNGNNPRGFYSYGFVSAGGASSGGGSAGVDLSAVWQSLKTNTDDYANQKINAYHIPIGTGLEIQNGLIVATNSGTVTGVSLAAGATNGTLHLVVNGTAQSDVAVTGLGSLAYKSSLVASDIPDLSGTYLPLAGGTMNADAAISWGNNDRTDWNTYVPGIRVMSSTSASSGAPTQCATGISVAARYNFQLAVEGGDVDNFYIRAKAREWKAILHSGNYTDYVNTTNFPGLNSTGTVTKITTGTGLTGGDISTTGTISIDSTYQGYITHGESAYNSLGNYVLKSGDTMTGNLTMGANSVVFNSSHSSTWANPQNSGLRILNTVGNSATGAPHNYAVGLSVSGYYGFQIASYGGETDTFWIRNTGNGGTANDWRTIWHNGNSGTSTTAWACSTLSASGQVTIAGSLNSGAAMLTITNNSSNTVPWLINSLAPNMPVGAFSPIIFGKANSSYNSATLTFYYTGDGSTSNYAGIGFYNHDNLFRVYGTGVTEVQSLKLSGTNATPTLSWDANAGAWKLSGNFYATGWVSAGGVSSSGGSGGIDADAMWGLLSNTDSTKQINVAHLSTALSSYVPASATNATNARYVIGDNNARYPQHALLQSGSGRQDTSPEGDTWIYYDTAGGSSTPWGIRHNQGLDTIGFLGRGVENITLSLRTGAITGTSFVKSGGTSSQFLKADGSVDSSTYLTGINSTMVTNALGYTPANSTALANYLPLTGGTISNSVYYPLAINNSTSGATFAGIQFNGAGTRLGNIFVNGADSTLHFYYGSSDNVVLHSGNYSSYTPILNSASTHATSSSVIYAPTTAGTAGQILISLGSGAPAWTSVARGNSNVPIYINSSGVLTEGVACLPLTGGTLEQNAGNILNINSTSTSGHNFMYFKVGGTSKASVGYYSGLAYVANETTYARIGVNDSGTPQYWSSQSSSTAQTLYHTGNLSPFSETILASAYSFDANALATERVHYTTAGDIGSAATGWSNFPTSGAPAGSFGLMTFKEGAYPLQFFHAYGQNDIWFRYKYYNSGSVWGSWQKIWNEGNFTPGNYVLKAGDTMSGDLTVGTNAIVYNIGHSSSWAYAQNSGIRIFNTVGQAATEAPNNYAICLSVAGYYRFQLAAYGGGNTFWMRSGSSDWVTLYHSGNSNKSDVAWACSVLTASVNSSSQIILETGQRNSASEGGGIAFWKTSYHFGEINASVLALNPRSGGNVGIGTASPEGKLHVNHTSYPNIILSSTSAEVSIYYRNSSGVYWAAGPGCWGSTAGYTSFVFGVYQGSGSSAWKAYITNGGNFVAVGAITAGAASDARLKTNISTLSDSDAKALIMALRPVTFTWNDKATELYDQYKGDDLGFVAQEVENVLPVAIGTIFEKYKRLDQTKFIAPLVAVAKDHETRIEKLEKEVKARDAKIMELENEVKRLRMN